MMTRPIIFAALLLAALPLTGFAAGKSASASMQVSFTVTESCTVQSGGAQPQVNCQLDTPYQMQARPAQAKPARDAAAPQAGKAGEQPTVVYF